MSSKSSSSSSSSKAKRARVADDWRACESEGDAARARGGCVAHEAREKYARAMAAEDAEDGCASRVWVKWAMMERRCAVDRFDALEAGLRVGLERAMEEALRAGTDAELLGSAKGVRDVGSQLALLLCQQAREDEAGDLLEFLGYTHRLGPDVLSYALAPSDFEKPPDGIVYARDGALSDDVLSWLRDDAFPFSDGVQTIENGFWDEHDYWNPKTGFFSYVQERRASSKDAESKMDVLVHLVRDIAAEYFPAVRDAEYAEWWAHARPHADGHQMHFDSHDEGIGGVKHPICSVIVYVDGACGGPTLVTNQLDKSTELASRGWLVYPKTGRIAVFNGDYLHGVIPGRGVRPEPDGRASGAPIEKRRTLMIAFWRDMDVLRTGHELGDWYPAGSARPFPPPSTNAPSWRHSFDLTPGFDVESLRRRVKKTDAALVDPVPVPAPWIRIDGATIPTGAPIPRYDVCFQGF